jgi:PBP1b-binding outer membrane lipoprotein LpoB
MRKQFLQIQAIVFCILIMSSCAKKEDSFEPDTSGNTENPADNKGSFTWTTSSGQSVTADSAHYYSQFTTIFAFKNGTSNSIEMNLSALSLGTYSFSSTSGNAFAFVDGSTNYDASSGSLTITASANNRLSGSFNTNLTGGAITSLSGTFTDIKKK